jgi:hypothetical protein
MVKNGPPPDEAALAFEGSIMPAINQHNARRITRYFFISSSLDGPLNEQAVPRTKLCLKVNRVYTDKYKQNDFPNL